MRVWHFCVWNKKKQKKTPFWIEYWIGSVSLRFMPIANWIWCIHACTVCALINFLCTIHNFFQFLPSCVVWFIDPTVWLFSLSSVNLVQKGAPIFFLLTEWECADAIHLKQKQRWRCIDRSKWCGEKSHWDHRFMSKYDCDEHSITNLVYILIVIMIHMNE